MPVVTPCAASIDTVKLVPCTERFTGVIGARLSWRARSSVIGMQIEPAAVARHEVDRFRA